MLQTLCKLLWPLGSSTELQCRVRSSGGRAARGPAACRATSTPQLRGVRGGKPAAGRSTGAARAEQERPAASAVPAPASRQSRDFTPGSSQRRDPALQGRCTSCNFPLYTVADSAIDIEASLLAQNARDHNVVDKNIAFIQLSVIVVKPHLTMGTSWLCTVMSTGVLYVIFFARLFPLSFFFIKLMLCNLYYSLIVDPMSWSCEKLLHSACSSNYILKILLSSTDWPGPNRPWWSL